MSATGGDIEARDNGQLIKILAVLEGGNAFLGRASNGSTARFSVGQTIDLHRGDVVFVGEAEWKIVPDAVWPDIPEVAVVRRVLDDGVVVEVGASIRVLPGIPAIHVDPGNTVEFNETDGITRVISETPLRFRDVGIDDEGLEDFLVGRAEGSGPTFESFGGYHEVRERAVELIETQLNKRGDLRAIGARPVKGIIFTGLPGTGKTYLARIIANESKAAFYLVSGPSIVSKWVGDSEDTLRRIFEAAAKDERAMIFFDEIDSIAERRTGDSHEMSKRLVAQLLTLLDGFDQGSGNVVVIAATNRIKDVDEALLRPGRFDWEISFGTPTLEDRYEILSVGARRLNTIGDLPLQEVALLTDGWSAARLASIWTEAALVAAGDNRKIVSDEDVALAFERVSGRPTRFIEDDDENGN
ncbi:AAA family ATPase [Saccharomonospora halophila]|uniref:AAA family ATPase n=1 Tax=Saccharomonospora halophila TaxID=129922 RepID=UPI0009FC3AC9|nr:AAA family ATPase [Saccharomonospora halophila]